MQYESQIKKYGDQWVEAVIARDKKAGDSISETKFAEAHFIEKWIT